MQEYESEQVTLFKVCRQHYRDILCELCTNPTKEDAPSVERAWWDMYKLYCVLTDEEKLGLVLPDPDGPVDVMLIGF
jgi:hypothetical protein